MKRGIITPTFEPHFKFVLKYLDSAEKYITDPENITFFFTVSEGDVEKLSKLLVNYKNKLNIKVLCFDELLRKHNVPYGDKKLLLKYGAKANYGYRDEKGKMPLYAMYPLNAAVRSSYILNKWNREDFMNDIKARIELLLEYGADINSIGAMGNTVVEWADSNPEIVLYLMDKGADHRLYGKELLRTSKRLLQASPNNIDRQEIIHRLEALGYK